MGGMPKWGAVDLVISAGTLMGNLYDYVWMTGHTKFPNDIRKFRQKSFEIYYVLSIVWKDGVAYRTGLGRVRKTAWRQHTKDKINLILG